MRILIAGNSPAVTVTAATALRASNYTIDRARTTIQVDDAVCVEEYDLVLLERRISDGDGIQLCRQLRGQGKNMPIMIIGAQYEPEHCIRGLDSGADDYLSLPLHMGEFLARVRTLLRRNLESRSPEITVGDLVLDPARREVHRGDRRIELLSKEFAILEYLMRNSGRILTQGQIGENIWGEEYSPCSNLIESYISRLRKKTEDKGETRLIQTVKGGGYKIIAL